jgi:hypothetical protein
MEHIFWQQKADPQTPQAVFEIIQIQDIIGGIPIHESSEALLG